MELMISIVWHELTNDSLVPRIIPKLANTKTVVIVPRTKRNQNTHPVVEKRLSSDCAVRLVVNRE